MLSRLSAARPRSPLSYTSWLAHSVSGHLLYQPSQSLSASPDCSKTQGCTTHSRDSEQYWVFVPRPSR